MNVESTTNEIDRARIERLEALRKTGGSDARFAALATTMPDADWDAIWTIEGRLAVVARCAYCHGPATDDYEHTELFAWWHRPDCLAVARAHYRRGEEERLREEERIAAEAGIDADSIEFEFNQWRLDDLLDRLGVGEVDVSSVAWQQSACLPARYWPDELQGEPEPVRDPHAPRRMHLIEGGER